MRFSCGTRVAMSIASAERASTASRSAATCSGAPATSHGCSSGRWDCNDTLMHTPLLREMAVQAKHDDAPQVNHCLELHLTVVWTVAS